MRGRKQDTVLRDSAAMRCTRELVQAFQHYNAELFDNQLPEDTMVMLRVKAHSDGYYSADRFDEREEDECERYDEISLNPTVFGERDLEDILSTLVHNMAHQSEYRLHGGKSRRSAYHSKTWASIMNGIGLIPSTDGKPGGEQTGHLMSHYIEEGGRFEDATKALLDAGFTLSYKDRARKQTRAATSKVKYTCSACGFNAWAKPTEEFDRHYSECSGMMVAESAAVERVEPEAHELTAAAAERSHPSTRAKRARTAARAIKLGTKAQPKPEPPQPPQEPQRAPREGVNAILVEGTADGEQRIPVRSWRVHSDDGIDIEYVDGSNQERWSTVGPKANADWVVILQRGKPVYDSREELDIERAT